MVPSTALRKGVLLFSTVLVALLLWLSVSFLVVANTERKDAQSLSQYMETDAILRDAAIDLAEERSASYWLTGIDGLFFAAEFLVTPRAATDISLNKVLTQLHTIMGNKQYANHLKFQPAHLQKLITKLEKQLSNLKSKRASLGEVLKLSPDLRDKNLQREVLDYYRALIEDLELLRDGTSYITSDQTRGTENIFAISDAAWNIGLSNQLLAALIEGYITGGSTAYGDAYSRATALQNNINDNLRTIRQIDAYANVDPELHKLADNLNKWHTGEYQLPVQQLIMAIANNTDAPYTNYDWRKTARTLDEHTQSILNRADEISTRNVTVAEARAYRNLLIDSVLVVACFLLMAVACWIIHRMHHQATHDELTGLSNRRSFKMRCDELLESPANNTGVTLLKVDLHKFKAINDRYGQLVGDKLLQSVARRMRRCIGPTTHLARIGGDEYAVLLSGTDHSKAKHIAQMLSEKLSDSHHIQGQSLQLANCIGYACFPQDADNSEELRKAADLALHAAKQKGAGSILPYEASIAKAFQERQQLESDLTVALDNGEFELHYQPQFDLQNCRVDGVEALIRWHHPTRGMVSPFHFIPVAEEAGLLPCIGEWVINEAARQASVWKKEHDLHLRMSVNVSAHQFVNGNIVENIQQALSRHDIDPASFEIEVTESVAMAEMELVVEELNVLHNLGVRIALDDFGTGYSSLSYLQDLPLDTLKIDRSFITKIDNGTHTQRLLLESIVSMAQLLNFHTVAEGVETDTQLKHVHHLGIDTIQGYYYSKPVSSNQIPADVEAIDAAHRNNKQKAA